MSVLEFNELTYPYFGSPPPLRGLIKHNHRMWGFVDARVYASAVDPYYEHWCEFPLIETADSAASLMGGYIEVQRSPDEYVVGMVSEPIVSGAETTNALLVFTNRSAYRIFGNSREDFELVVAFDTGLSAPDSLVTFNGFVVWFADNRFWAIRNGSNTPVRISDSVWPDGVNVDPATIRAVSYNDFYVWCSENEERTWFWHAQQSTWTSYPVRCEAIAARESGLVGYAPGLINGKKRFYQFFAADTASVRAVTQPIPVGDLTSHKSINRAYIITSVPPAEKNVSIATLRNRSTSSGQPVTATTRAAAQGDATTITQTGPVPGGGFMLQLSVEYSGSNPVEIYGIGADVHVREGAR